MLYGMGDDLRYGSTADRLLNFSIVGGIGERYLSGKTFLEQLLCAYIARCWVFSSPPGPYSHRLGIMYMGTAFGVSLEF